MSEQVEFCKRCKNELNGNFCSNCGKPRSLKRIDGKYILSEIGSVLNFDKGILYTIRELLLRPGQNIQNFINEDRNRLVKPIIFIIICSLIYTIVQQLLHFEDAYVSYLGPSDSAATKIFGWIQRNYGYANILMAIFIAFWIRVFFRKHGYNLFEILILLCFVMGVGMLIYSIFGTLESFTNWRVLHIGGILGVTYAAWAIGRFFGKAQKVNYLKGFISYLLGMTTFNVLAIILGFLIDQIVK
ncbi:MAG: DUF3667 domain-containing protein [Chitinophagales bacterium]|nr:DUF3667 domain-containing protein [Chitinophagales bacterium]